MKIDRANVTPEIMKEMRETLCVAGVDHGVLTDEEVIQRIERLLDAMVEFGKQIQKVLVEPMLRVVINFTRSPAGQQLLEFSESPEGQAYLEQRRTRQ